MSIIKITANDILRGQPLDPDWYKARVADVNMKQSSKGDSTNIVITFEIEKDGRTMDHYFNSKAMGFMVPFLSVINGTAQIKAAAAARQDLQIDTSELVNKKLQIRLEMDTYQGNLKNKIVDFLPYEASTVPEF